MTTTDNTIPPEPWVDCAAVGRHLGFSDDHVRKMAERGDIPAQKFQNGKRTFWRFRISDVDTFLTRPTTHCNVITMPVLAGV